MAKIQRLRDISGQVLYPKTVADAVMYDEHNTMGALVANSLYMGDDDGSIDELDAIDADTLDGHDSSYFASREDLNDRIDDVNASIRELLDIETGPAGKSAYEYAQDGGYEGTEEEFAVKLATDHIDWFGVGISIPAGADLNTYKTNGKYYCNSEAIAQKLLNRPSGMNTNFVMWVFQRTTNKIYSQLMLTLTGKMYIRSANSSKWRDWVAYTTSDEAESMITSILNDAKSSGLFDGPVGKSAYEYAQEGGYAGTEAEFAEDINPDTIKDQLNNYIATELAKRGQLKPEYANSVEECTDITKLYVLPDGYIWAYMTKTVTTNPTNQIEHAIDSSGDLYNGKGYKDETRLSLSSGETGQGGYTTTGFIEVNPGDTIRFANINTTYTDNNIFIIFYNSNLEWVGYLRNEDATNVLKAGEYVLGSNPTLTSGTLDGTAYFRVSMKTNINGNYLITVNEPLEPTTTTTQDWHNTGHAFVPANYENRIVDLEERMDELSTGNSNIPTYITEEVKRVADIVKEKQTVGSLTFTAMSDMHIRTNDSYWADNRTSCRDAGLGLAELQRFLRLDCAVMLGDYTVGGASDTIAQVKKDLTGVRNYMANGMKDIPNIWITGNHDINYGATSDRRMTEDELFAYLTNNNKCTVQDVGNIGRNYGYIDFENQKIRCVYLNTADALDYPDNTDGNADDAMEITAAQAQWLVNVGLDFSDKPTPTEWGIVLLSHHCLCQFPPVTAILTAYKDGASGSTSITTNGDTEEVIYDFTSANRGEIICAIHGHDHNFTYRKISSELWYQVTEANAWLWSICVPNMDTTRNNEKAKNEDENYRNVFGEFDSNKNPVYYPKKQGTCTSTSFCVFTIDRKNGKIHAIAYGAGIDREISYKLTNF